MWLQNLDLFHLRENLGRFYCVCPVLGGVPHILLQLFEQWSCCVAEAGLELSVSLSQPPGW